MMIALHKNARARMRSGEERGQVWHRCISDVLNIFSKRDICRFLQLGAAHAVLAGVELATLLLFLRTWCGRPRWARASVHANLFQWRQTMAMTPWRGLRGRWLRAFPLDRMAEPPHRTRFGYY